MAAPTSSRPVLMALLLSAIAYVGLGYFTPAAIFTG